MEKDQSSESSASSIYATPDSRQPRSSNGSKRKPKAKGKEKVKDNKLSRRQKKKQKRAPKRPRAAPAQVQGKAPKPTTPVAPPPVIPDWQLLLNLLSRGYPVSRDDHIHLGNKGFCRLDVTLAPDRVNARIGRAVIEVMCRRLREEMRLINFIFVSEWWNGARFRQLMDYYHIRNSALMARMLMAPQVRIYIDSFDTVPQPGDIVILHKLTGRYGTSGPIYWFHTCDATTNASVIVYPGDHVVRVPYIAYMMGLHDSANIIMLDSALWVLQADPAGRCVLPHPVQSDLQKMPYGFKSYIMRKLLRLLPSWVLSIWPHTERLYLDAHLLEKTSPFSYLNASQVNMTGQIKNLAEHFSKLQLTYFRLIKEAQAPYQEEMRAAMLYQQWQKWQRAGDIVRHRPILDTNSVISGQTDTLVPWNFFKWGGYAVAGVAAAALIKRLPRLFGALFATAKSQAIILETMKTSPIWQQIAVDTPRYFEFCKSVAVWWTSSPGGIAEVIPGEFYPDQGDALIVAPLSEELLKVFCAFVCRYNAFLGNVLAFALWSLEGRQKLSMGATGIIPCIISFFFHLFLFRRFKISPRWTTFFSNIGIHSLWNAAMPRIAIYMAKSQACYRREDPSWDVSEAIVKSRTEPIDFALHSGVYQGTNQRVERRRDPNPCLSIKRTIRFKTRVDRRVEDDDRTSYFTRFWGYPLGDMPANTNENRLAACGRLVNFEPEQEDAFVHSQKPSAQKVRHKLRSGRLLASITSMPVDPQDPQLIEEWEEHLRTENVKRYKDLQYVRANPSYPKGTTTTFVKSDEISLRSVIGEDTVEQELKPRIIHDVSTPWLILVGPAVYYYQKRLKVEWDGFKINDEYSLPDLSGTRVRFRLFYAASHPIRLGRALDAFESECFSGVSVLVLICGDDTAIFIKYAQKIYQIETDFKNYDACQSLEILEIEYLFLQLMGMDLVTLDHLRSLSQNRIVMRSAHPRISGTLFTAKGAHRDTGGADTSLGNSIVTGVLMTYCLKPVVYSLVIQRALITDLEKELYDRMLTFGMYLKIQSHPVVDLIAEVTFTYTISFLKGMFVRSVENENVWIPLPSRILKIGVFKKDYWLEFRVPPDSSEQVLHECMKLRLWQIAQQLLPFVDVPILGAFVKRFGGIKVDESLSLRRPRLMYMEWDNEDYGGVVFDPGGINKAFVGRYSITPSQIEEFEEMILGSYYDSILIHPIEVALLSDY